MIKGIFPNQGALETLGRLQSHKEVQATPVTASAPKLLDKKAWP